MTYRLPAKHYSHSLLAALRMVLMVVALLNYATASAQHEHSGPGPESLCAICVYASSSGGTLSTHDEWHKPLSRHGAIPSPEPPPAAIHRAPATISIRGPPPTA